MECRNNTGKLARILGKILENYLDGQGKKNIKNLIRKGVHFMKRYGEFITSEEELAFLATIRKYIEKEVMPFGYNWMKTTPSLRRSTLDLSSLASKSAVSQLGMGA